MQKNSHDDVVIFDMFDCSSKSFRLDRTASSLRVVTLNFLSFFKVRHLVVSDKAKIAMSSTHKTKHS